MADNGIEAKPSQQPSSCSHNIATHGGANANDKRAVLVAERASAEAELTQTIAAEKSYAMQAEAQQMQAEREQAAHAEAEKAKMLEFAESIGTTVQFENPAPVEGLNQELMAKQSPPRVPKSAVFAEKLGVLLEKCLLF